MDTLFIAEVHPLSVKQLKDNWGWYLALGISLIALGTLAVFYTWTATLVSVVYLGFLLLTLGVFEAVKSWKINRWSTFFLHMFLSVLYGVSGAFLIADPTINAITLTLLLSIFFVVAGVIKVVVAWTRLVPHKFWLTLNGILTAILGILIWYQWPESSFWAVGMLVGINMIITGWTWVMLSMVAKNVKGA
ncbi:MAG: HdeD family acid-resistance protein [Candidatus Babeliales bacterium]